MSWKWFGVKTLYRTRAIGRPKDVDENFDPDATLLEERVVLIRARNFDEAIEKAEEEARIYVNTPHGGNAYAQRVVQRYLRVSDAYELFEPPGSRREVYSRTWVVPKSVGDSELAQQCFGASEPPRGVRAKFLDAQFIQSLTKHQSRR